MGKKHPGIGTQRQCTNPGCREFKAFTRRVNGHVICTRKECIDWATAQEPIPEENYERTR